jgi:sugar/nucleoside kinase (ribokinase family)
MGALLFDGQNLIQVSAPQVKAIDTNGAGDMFAGAFLYALCQGHDFSTAGEFATQAAAQVVAQFGPRLKGQQHDDLKQAFFKLDAG